MISELDEGKVDPCAFVSRGVGGQKADDDHDDDDDEDEDEDEDDDEDEDIFGRLVDIDDA